MTRPAFLLALAVACGLVLLAFSGCRTAPIGSDARASQGMVVGWMGDCVAGEHGPNPPMDGRYIGFPKAECGLREDGVVVWRKKP